MHALYRVGILFSLLFVLILPSQPAEAAISWYEYTVTCRDWLSNSYNIKVGGCSGKCFEGHDCTNCSGWEVRKGGPWGQLMQAGTDDKTKCCKSPSYCGNDPRYNFCNVYKNCPANDCPGEIYWASTWAVAVDRLQCSPGSKSVYIDSQQLLVGTRHDNTPLCGSHCDNSDPFTPQNVATVAFGYFANWSCDGQNHIDKDCTITAISACGNGVCELVGNEHEYNCPQDCSGCDGSDPDCEE